MFTVPVVLFIFKREKTTLEIIERLRTIKPTKVYLLSDAGRTVDEKKIVEKVRNSIIKAIDWDCEVIENFAQENRGVFQNIGLGAKWIFEREDCAIFLEDDNLPELSFFPFCEELLKKFWDDDEVLWVCGTNYLRKYTEKEERKQDYYFTRNLLPCGWASWGKKFLKYYDENFNGIDDKSTLRKIKKTYALKCLYFQQIANFMDEHNRKETPKGYLSWDYQMEFSIRKYGKYGIIPNFNQIRNIGDDQASIHGGDSLDKVMTRRFCQLPTYSIEFPLNHPDKVEIEPKLEKEINKIILYPCGLRARFHTIRLIKHFLHIDIDTPLKQGILEKFILK